MKSRFSPKTLIIAVSLISALSFVFLEVQDYCLENDLEITHLIENGEFKSMLLPDVFFIENIIKNIFKSI
jgi:hypothetical protein